MDGIITTELTNSLGVVFLLALASFGLTMALTPLYTFFAYKYKLWKTPRTGALTGEETPVLAKLQEGKYRRNMPMMAGLVFVAVIALCTLAFNLDRAQTWLPLVALLGGALVGLIDDVVNVRGFGKSLRPLLKIFLITAVGVIVACYFVLELGYASVRLPFAPTVLELGLWAIPLFAFAVVATSNAVNITDGIDGLAGGLAVMAFGFFGIIALLQGNVGIAGFCLTVVGALLAYTWFNIPPARFFMSDVGAFALGTSLAVVAILADTLFLLPIIAFVFVADTATSIIQIVSKKLFKRKIFLSAPIHQHFEAIGWPETKVTMRFWLVGQACGSVGLGIALMGGYIQ